MPNFKKNTSPVMKRNGFKMKRYAYPGTSPVQQVAYDKDGEPIHKKKTKTQFIAPKKLYGKNIEGHSVTPPKTPRKDTLKGKTHFQTDIIPVTNVIKKGVNIVKKMIESDKKRIKKVKDYFTKK